MSKPVTKAVIAAAGFGTRFLPQTKAMPKEMLPLVDKPIIQYIVEDLVADLPTEDLLNNLRAGGEKKKHYIDEIETIAGLANFVYVRQKGPYGTATPIMNVAHLIGDQPFIYAFADDLTVATPNAFQQIIRLYDELGGSVLPCLRLTQDVEYDRYGIVGGQELRDGVIKLDSVVEKPGKDKAPSDLASVGGYLFTPEIFEYLDEGLRNLQADKEFYVTDSILMPMLADGKSMYGCEIKDSKRYDTGDKLEYIKTVVDFALEREDIGPELRAYLQKKL
jgi:UTP--glucose-1-phosphate uridylyltransferase